MEKKYYDLISSLIKNHKKYNNYSSIHEELVDHVYEQAKTIINTIEDEKVVEEYLCKIIASAFFTVPKKLNCNIAQRKNFSDEILEQNTRNRDQRTQDDQEELITDTLYSHDDTVELNDNIEETIQMDTPINEDSVDKTLIDRMINGVASEQTTQEVEVNAVAIDKDTETIYDSLDEFNTTIDNLAIVEEIEDEDSKTVDEETITLDFDNKDEILDTDVDEIIIHEEIEEVILESDSILEAHQTEANEHPEADLLEIAENNEEELVEETVILDEDQTDDYIETVEENIPENNEDIISETIESEDDLLNIEEDIEIFEENYTIETGTNSYNNELLEEELVSYETFEEDTNNTDNLLENIDGSEENSILDKGEIIEEIPTDNDSCYTFFQYEPLAEEIDSEEILSELKNLDQKYPEKQILEIVKLKYNDKLSLADISNRMNLTVNEIIETLNKVVEIVKD